MMGIGAMLERGQKKTSLKIQALRERDGIAFRTDGTAGVKALEWEYG